MAPLLNDTFVRTFKCVHKILLFRLLLVPIIQRSMARGRPLKGTENRERLTVRLPPETIKGVKRAAKRKKISQADYIDAAVRPALIKDGLLKEAC